MRHNSQSNKRVAGRTPPVASPARQDWRARVWAAVLDPELLEAEPNRDIPEVHLSCKGRGELAEARFLAKAMSLGLVVSKPFGDNAKYDFIVEHEGHMARVQVKSAWVAARREHEYQFGTSPARTDVAGTRPYRKNEVDFLVAYVAPEDVWYIIPIKVLLKKNHLMFRTDAEDEYTEYREAWERLTGRASIWAMADWSASCHDDIGRDEGRPTWSGKPFPPAAEVDGIASVKEDPCSWRGRSHPSRMA